VLLGPLPDLAFRAGKRKVYVADAKYKLTGTGRARNADCYQLLAYTTAMNLPEGVLVYCQADGPVPPRAIEVRHTGRRLQTYALDLSGPPAAVTRSVDELARWIGDRVENLAVQGSTSRRAVDNRSRCRLSHVTVLSASEEVGTNERGGTRSRQWYNVERD
jgi:hypothetical protein